MNLIDWNKPLGTGRPEINKSASEGILAWMKSGSTRKYSRSRSAAKAIKRRRSFHAKSKSIKQEGDDELRRLRLICQRQEEELKEQRALHEELQQENEDLRDENEDLRDENEFLHDRLRYAQDELEVLHFLHTPDGGDEFDAIGPLHLGLVEEPGKRVGDYNLCGLLGKGSFGRVWYGQGSKNPTQEVAVKEFDKSKIHSTRMLNRLKLECAILRYHGNRHPNIIGFRGVLHARENIYLVMEKADDCLTSYVGHQRVQPDFAQQVMIGVLRALSYLHEQGISHGDIDPQNVLICKSANSQYIGADAIRLCDFGLAHTRESAGEDQGSFQFGKPGYLAPELAAPSKEEDQVPDYCKADMWSLGCTLMAMTNRLTPSWFEYYNARRSDPSYFQASIAAYVEKLRQDIIARSAGDALELDFLLNVLLQVDRASRWSAAAALTHPWFRFSYPSSLETTN